MRFHCNTSRSVLKKAGAWTVLLAMLWAGGGWLAVQALAQQGDGPTIRDVERQLDRHINEAELSATERRLGRVEAAVLRNTIEITWAQGGGASLGVLLLGLNILNLIGVKFNPLKAKPPKDGT